MKFVAERAARLKQGAIRAMFDKAASMTDVISMGIGEPDMATPQSVCDAATEALNAGCTHYTPNAGLPETRAAVSRFGPIAAANYDPKTEIIMTNGGMGALSLLVSVLVEEGDEIMIQDPQWLNYVAQIEFYGGKVVRVPVKAEDGFALKAGEIEKRITPKTKLLLVNSPNNPTGAVLEHDELVAIAEVAIKHDILVVSDEVYNTLMYDGAKFESICTIPGMRERCIVINSFSKSYAMTGWRIGYAAGPAYIIDRMIKAQENLNACANSFGQKAAIFALDHPELCDELCDVFAERREVLLAGLQSIEGIKCAVPKGAFYLFPDITAFGLDSVTFCERLLEEQRVVCIPGSAFGACGEGYIRIAYTNDVESIRAAVERIRVFCDGLRK